MDGFGFIVTDAHSVDLYVHYANIKTGGKALLKPGQKVSYQLRRDGNEPEALDVRLLVDKEIKPVDPTAG